MTTYIDEYKIERKDHSEYQGLKNLEDRLDQVAKRHGVKYEITGKTETEPKSSVPGVPSIGVRLGLTLTFTTEVFATHPFVKELADELDKLGYILRSRHYPKGSGPPDWPKEES